MNTSTNFYITSLPSGFEMHTDILIKDKNRFERRIVNCYSTLNQYLPTYYLFSNPNSIVKTLEEFSGGESIYKYATSFQFNEPICKLYNPLEQLYLQFIVGNCGYGVITMSKIISDEELTNQPTVSVSLEELEKLIDKINIRKLRRPKELGYLKQFVSIVKYGKR